MVQAGIAEGHIPQSWAKAFVQSRSSQERPLAGIPKLEEWSESRVKNGRTEYSPSWDFLAKAIVSQMLPMTTEAQDASFVNENHQNNGGRSKGRGIC